MFPVELESDDRIVRLSHLVSELGPTPFSNPHTFASLLTRGESTEGPHVSVNEDDVAECLAIMAAQAQAQGGLLGKDASTETFIDTIGDMHPLFGWAAVFECFGRIIGERVRADQVNFDEALWMVLLRAWQRARLQIERVAHLADIPPNQSMEALLARPLPPPEDLFPSERQMFPLAVLPLRPDNRLLSSLVDFMVGHDTAHQSTLVVQALLEAPPSTNLLEIAHNLFYNHSKAVFDQHQLDLNTFLSRRLSMPKEGSVFLLKVGGFLHEKLTALMGLYLAASQGRDPLQSIDPKTTLILDASKTMVYFNALFACADASAEDMAFSFNEPRIAQHFERLRMMAVEIYHEDAVAVGLDRRSFVKPEPRRVIPEPRGPPGSNNATGDFFQKPACQNLDAQEDYYFGCFYRHEISATQLVDLLARLAACPSNTPEAELLARMLRTLFTECRHFPRYPPPQLHRTADFFGKLIRSELLLKRPELQRLAIRCVMEALRKDVYTNIFRFGLVALQGFIDIAPCSPAFLANIEKMKGLREFFPNVVKYAETCHKMMPKEIENMSLISMPDLQMAIAPNELPSSAGVLIIPPTFQLIPHPQQQRTSERTFGHVSPPDVKRTEQAYKVRLCGFGLGQVENLLEDREILSQIIAPPEPVKNRVAQIFNSLVITNIHQKIAELISVLQSEWYPWLAYYIVKTRASKEMNYHELYAQAAEAIGHPQLIDMLTDVSYDCINILLKYVNSAREATSYRTVLKSLGSWLGLLTLGRNKPLKSKSFDVKHLMYDAYERGNLIAIVPLVCAVLEHIKNSKIFKLPNPWTMSALLCLGCLYTMPNLKQTICFEIELLMRALGLELQPFLNQQPNIFLSLEAPSTSSDFQPTKPSPSADQTSSSTRGDAPSSPKKTDSDRWPTTDKNFLGSHGGSQLLSTVAKSVIISPSLALFQKNPHLRVAVPVAIERAIKELVGMISERAVGLAVATTVQLILKDFCLETDEVLVKRAAHLMAASLGGSIVMVTGRSPLRMAIVQHLKELIKSADLDEDKDDQFIDHTAQMIAAENLNVGSTLIEGVVFDQTVAGVQEALGPHLAARSNKDEPGRLLPDENANSKWPRSLPSPLRLTGSLDQRQLQIYKDFAEFGPLRRVQQKPEKSEDNLTLLTEDEVGQKNPLSPLPPPPAHVSPQKPLSAEASIAAIDVAVAALKEGVKELVYSPLVSSASLDPDREYITPEGCWDTLCRVPPTASPALRILATLPSSHEIFTQIDLVVRLVAYCDQQESVAQSTARRLLRSIYDAANRGVQQAANESDVEVEISAIYLETFVALLKRFEEYRLVGKLKEVVSLWLVNATSLSPNQQETGWVDFTKFTADTAAHALLVLTTAAKYRLVDFPTIDSDLVALLLKQALDCVESGRDELIAIQVACEFAIQTVYVLIIDYACVDNFDISLQNTIREVNRLKHMLDTSNSMIEQIGSAPLKCRTQLNKQASNIQQAIQVVWAGLQNPPIVDEGRCMTIQDLLKYKMAHGARHDKKQVAIGLTRPPPRPDHLSHVEYNNISNAMEAHQLKPGVDLEATLTHCVNSLCRGGITS